jgi:transposase
MWTETTRAQYARAGLALPSDLTDAEWAVLEPLLPPASHVGRPRKWPIRRIVEAVLYLLRGGLPWRMLPPCFPPVSTVRHWFYLWRDNGLWLTINHTLLMLAREVGGREGIVKLTTRRRARAEIRNLTPQRRTQRATPPWRLFGRFGGFCGRRGGVED